LRGNGGGNSQGVSVIFGCDADPLPNEKSERGGTQPKPPSLDGKEGVAGSSPAEGLPEIAQVAATFARGWVHQDRHLTIGATWGVTPHRQVALTSHRVVVWREAPAGRSWMGAGRSAPPKPPFPGPIPPPCSTGTPDAHARYTRKTAAQPPTRRPDRTQGHPWVHPAGGKRRAWRELARAARPPVTRR
jgi:hypothetical protein